MDQPTLFERQTALLRYLVDPCVSDASLQDMLLGPDRSIDPTALALVADMGLRKRFDKVRTKLPMTSRALGDSFPRLIKEFAHAFPPTGIRRIDAAEQFEMFLETRQHELGEKPYLLDLCRAEVALARIMRPEEEVACFGATFRTSDRTNRCYRVRAVFEIVRCAFDIRPLFENMAVPEVERRQILLTVVCLAGRHRIFEVPPGVFALLNAIRTFNTNVVEFVEDADADQNADLLEQLGIVEDFR